LTPYKTIFAPCEAEIIEKKSRFIGSAFPISNEADALERLKETRKRYSQANHNCYAYRLAGGTIVERYSDDGEPSRTAGMPILGVISSIGLVNVLVIVTRYFGGILLGAGGLTRAYSGAAAATLSKAEIIEKTMFTRLKILTAYDYYNKIMIAVEASGCIVADTVFQDNIEITSYVAAEKSDAAMSAVTNASNGRAVVFAEDTVLAYTRNNKIMI